MVLLMYFDTHHNHTKAFISEKRAFVAANPRFSEEHILVSFVFMKLSFLKKMYEILVLLPEIVNL